MTFNGLLPSSGSINDRAGRPSPNGSARTKHETCSYTACIVETCIPRWIIAPCQADVTVPRYSSMQKRYCWLLVSLMFLAGCAVPSTDLARPRTITPVINRSFYDRSAVSIEQAVADVPRIEFPNGAKQNPEGPPLQLVWSRTYFGSPQWDRPKLLVTCHGIDEVFGQLVRFYVAKSDRFEPLLEAAFGEGYLQEPQLWTESRQWFLFLRSHSGGSSTYYNYLLVWLGENDARRLAIEQPVEALADLVGQGQHTDPGRTAIVSAGYNGPLVFSFSIWNDGDLSNFPTGGSVDGEFEFQLDSQGRPEQFVVARWTGPE